MTEELDTVLKHEIQAHSVYDTSMQPTYHGVPLPGGKLNRTTVKLGLSCLWDFNVAKMSLY